MRHSPLSPSASACRSTRRRDVRARKVVAHYTATIGRYADGTVGEIFLQNHKPGSQSDSNARDAAVASSLALQHGCPLATLQRALLRDSHGRPSTPLGAAVDTIMEISNGR